MKAVLILVGFLLIVGNSLVAVAAISVGNPWKATLFFSLALVAAVCVFMVARTKRRRSDFE